MANIAYAGHFQQSLVIGIVTGQIKNLLLKLAYLFRQQINPIKLLRGIHHDKRMREPLFEIILIGEFDVIARGRKDALTQKQLSKRAILVCAKSDGFQASAEQITHRAG